MKIKELYSDASKWTQGTFYKDKSGNKVNSKEDGVSFCLIGAVDYCYVLHIEWFEIYNKIANKVGCPPTVYNDDKCRTFEEVKALVEELDI